MFARSHDGWVKLDSSLSAERYDSIVKMSGLGERPGLLKDCGVLAFAVADWITLFHMCSLFSFVHLFWISLCLLDRWGIGLSVCKMALFPFLYCSKDDSTKNEILKIFWWTGVQTESMCILWLNSGFWLPRGFVMSFTRLLVTPGTFQMQIVFFCLTFSWATSYNYGVSNNWVTHILITHWFKTWRHQLYGGSDVT